VTENININFYIYCSSW